MEEAGCVDLLICTVENADPVAGHGWLLDFDRSASVPHDGLFVLLISFPKNISSSRWHGSLFRERLKREAQNKIATNRFPAYEWTFEALYIYVYIHTYE